MMMDNDDRILWDRARAGDAAAFGDLYTRHARQVYTYCFWRTGDATVAEDLSAAVFLEVWAARGRTELTELSPLPWLLGVAHNLVRNQWRANRRRRAALARLPPLRDSPDHVDDVAARVDARRRMAAVLRACERLPERDLEVLQMCVWMGLSPADAATALGIAVGTVHSRLHRARVRLRDEVGEAAEHIVHRSEAVARRGHEPDDGIAPSRTAPGGAR